MKLYLYSKYQFTKMNITGKLLVIFYCYYYLVFNTRTYGQIFKKILISVTQKDV